MSLILIVDDQSDNIDFLQTFLEGEGYDVVTAMGGWAALRQVRALRPDLILLDIMMPDMSGYEMAQRIREKEHLAKVPIIFVTAYSDIDRQEGLAMGATAFIRKPIDCDQLLKTVKAYCNF